MFTTASNFGFLMHFFTTVTLFLLELVIENKLDTLLQKLPLSVVKQSWAGEIT